MDKIIVYIVVTVMASEFDALSNERIKTNIANLESSLDIIKQLRPVTFN